MKIQYKWKCSYCDAVLTVRSKLYQHLHETHPEKCRPARKCQWQCKYCSEKFLRRQELLDHFKVCEEKHKLPHDKLGRVIDVEAHRRSVETLNRRISSGEIICRGHQHTPEWRAKMAEIMLSKKSMITVQCNYSEKACQYIDRLNESKGWKLQHALNGGEVRVGPYSLDGYDKEKNIAFEYDENSSRHNSKKGRERDIARQQYIISQIGCEFWRYSEREDRLYRVE